MSLSLLHVFGGDVSFVDAQKLVTVKHIGWLNLLHRLKEKFAYIAGNLSRYLASLGDTKSYETNKS